MATMIRFILEFQRKCKFTDTADIINIGSIRPTEIEDCTEEMAKLLPFILEIQRKCQGSDTVDIDNIDGQ
jgi:hypothetical protein